MKTRKTDPTEAEDEHHFTVAEIAARYRVTARTVRGWIADKKMKARRIGRLLRVPQSAVDTFDKNH
jgi:excisionase family DNA binding protein